MSKGVKYTEENNKIQAAMVFWGGADDIPSQTVFQKPEMRGLECATEMIWNSENAPKKAKRTIAQRRKYIK